MSDDTDEVDLPTVNRLVDLTPDIYDISPRPVGYGGYADIYNATWRSVSGDIKVALKVIRASSRSVPPVSTSVPPVLQHEVSAWKRLIHPNIHVLFGVFHGFGPVPAMVSRWYENGDINEYIRRRAADHNIQSLKLKLLADVMCGLTFLHTHDVIHGDIKGGNVLISDEGVARLCDFGFTRLRFEHSHSSSNTHVKGTFRWMAPELVLGQSSRISWATDIWACGCLFIEVWSDKIPYHTKGNEVQVMIAMSRCEPPARPPGIFDLLWDIVTRLHNFEPNSRPTSSQVGLQLLALQEHGSVFEGTNLAPTVVPPVLHTPADIAAALEDLKSLEITPSVHSVGARPSAGGGSADVYEGEWHDLKIKVALKVVRKLDRDVTMTLATKWRQEIRTWGRLSHPHVVPLLGLCWNPWPAASNPLLLPATVSPWCSFGNINQYLRARPASWGRKLRLLNDVLSGLDYIHDAGFVHTDIKGDNVLVSEDEIARISDFGGSAFFIEHLEQTRSVLGTDRWMAPELFHAHSRATPHSDIWAVGGLIYEVVTGKHPYHTFREHEVMIVISTGKLPLRPGNFPNKFWELAMQCWNLVSGDRPTTTVLLGSLQTFAACSESELQEETEESYNFIGTQRRRPLGEDTGTALDSHIKRARGGDGNSIARPRSLPPAPPIEQDQDVTMSEAPDHAVYEEVLAWDLAAVQDAFPSHVRITPTECASPISAPS